MAGFRSMKWREVRRSEKLTEKDRKKDGFEKIKPKGNMTVKECDDFWKNEFKRMRAE